MTAEDKAAVKSPANADGGATSLAELKRLGKYQIERKIGAGGMGAVFLAKDTELKRTVALKVLPRDKAENPILVRRFRAEAQASAQLRHPNIVAVYDSGEDDGYLYIAMEYVEGRDLFEMVSLRGLVPIRRSIDIIKQVAAALQHAYEQNIVHRDIKPSNLLIGRNGVVKLTDLGLARSIDDTLETNITRAGTTVGTVDYMSPEQARNSKLADIRSDLYSLGCTWYQMLTGSAPYPEGSVTNKLQAHATRSIPDPRDKNPAIPEGLTAVIRRMMAKKPEDRYQTPAELIDELNHARLTNAAISREIFSDLSDDEQSTGPVEEEALSDDGYFDLENDDQETPDAVPLRDAATPRKKSERPTTTNVDPNKTDQTSARSKSRSTTDDEDDTEEAPHTAQKARTRPVKSDRKNSDPDPAEGSRVARPRVTESSDDEADPESNDRKARPKTVKAENVESTVSPGSKSGDSKANDTKSAKSKPIAPKAMPPKRQPIENEDDGKKSINLDYLRYAAFAVVGVLFLVGLNWLISRLGNTVAIDNNPFGTPADGVAANSGVPVVPEKATPNTNANVAKSETPSNVGTATSGNPKPDAAFDVEKIPDWVKTEVASADLQKMTVGPGANNATHFATLSDALQATTSGSPAIITLQGNGPFTLPMVELTQRRRIVISSSSAQDRPVIFLKPAEGQSTAGLKFSDGILELRGLHFSIDRQILPNSLKVVEVIDGQLICRQCSFTANGTSNEPAVALVVESASDSNSVPRIEPNVLVDDVLIRGAGLEGLSIRRANVDAVVRNSLMVTGSAACIELSGHIASSLTDVATTKPRRVIRFQRCTLSSQTRIFDLSVDEKLKPPATAMVLRDCICAAQGVEHDSAIAFAGKWPQAKTTSESWLTKMTWTSTNTIYLGFEQLIDLGASFKVVDASAWQRVWNARTDSKQFQKMAFPETISDELSNIHPQEFNSNGLAYRDIKATDGGLPGCPVNTLKFPDVTSQQRALALTFRPSPPASMTSPVKPVQVKKVDLKKDDLGTILNKNDWVSGTTFEASGGGICMMSAARIEGKSLKIVFLQSEGAPLRLQPKIADQKAVPQPLISISRGSLELTNAVVEANANPKVSVPEWLIQSTDSTVMLTGCRLMGADADGTRNAGIIRWNTTAPSQPSPESPALVIRDSFLAGTGCGVRAECGQGAMIFRNSVIVVRGDAFDLRPSRSGTSLLSIFDAEKLTVSATNATIRFEAAPGADPVVAPLRIFVDRCVFGPPVVFKKDEAANATLLQFVGPVTEQKQVEWWGVSNGVARQVVHLIRRDSDTGAASETTTGIVAWRKLWDKSGSLRMLTGEKGVYLATDLPIRWKDIRPTSFLLNKNSQAMTWGDEGQLIGANPVAVEDASSAKKFVEPSKPPTPPPNVPTKKNIGF